MRNVLRRRSTGRRTEPIARPVTAARRSTSGPAADARAVTRSYAQHVASECRRARLVPQGPVKSPDTDGTPPVTESHARRTRTADLPLQKL